MTQRLLNRISTAGNQKVILFIIIICFNCLIVAGQKSKTNPDLLATFPFTLLSGGVVLLEARLDSFPDTLTFILDTGSGGISLDSATVAYYHLPVTPTSQLLRGFGTVKKVSYVVNRTLHLPKLDVENLNFHINDYEFLTYEYGIKIHGIIGFSFLSRYIVKINYDNHTMEVWNPGSVKIPKTGHTLTPLINGIPIFQSTVADATRKNASFYFDTGAGLCVLLSEKFVKDSSLLLEGKKIIKTHAEGIGGRSEIDISTIKEFKIGKYKFKKVPTHIFKDEFNITAYPYLGGLIGNDLLRRFNLIINYQESKIHLQPNKHFREPFDYSYTGVVLYYIDGRIVIESVLENSPGAVAGLQEGDIIVAIDNRLHADIQTYKSLLQTEGARLKIVVLRGKDIITVRLKVKSILQ